MNTRILVSITMFYLLALNQLIAQPGTLDNSFNIGTGANNDVYAISIQNDSKIIVGGGFTSFNGVSQKNIIRLNANGSIDGTFSTGTGPDLAVFATGIQNDGKIIIAGLFTSYNGTSINHIARLNTNGTLDGTFNVGTGANQSINAIAIQSNGKIIIGGSFTNFNGTLINRIARLNTDGSLDGTFTVGTGADNSVNAIVVQSDGKIVIGGRMAIYNGSSRNGIARLNTNGTVDGTFVVGTGATNSIYTNAIAIQSDGKIIIGGAFIDYNGTQRNHIARLNSNGSLDNTFTIGTGANNAVWTISIQMNGKIVIGGQFSTYNGTPKNYITRLNNNGTLDNTFTTGTGSNSFVTSTAIQSDGKIIFGGWFNSYNGTARNRIARINGDPLTVPTLSEWGLISLTVLFLGFGVFHLRNKIS